MKINKRRIQLLLAIVIAACALQYIYSLWAVGAYAYRGYVGIDASIPGLAVQSVLLAFTVGVMPIRIDRPSDFFLMFYAWFVLLPAAIFYSISGYVAAMDAILLYTVLVFPLIAISLARKAPIRVPMAPFIPEKVLIVGIIAIAGLVFAIAFFRGITFSLEYDAMYERRMVGRDVIGSRNLFAYAFAATINGFVPFLGLLAGYKRNFLLGGFAVAIALTGFAAIGTKSPVAVSLLFFVLGWVRPGKANSRLPALFATLMVAIILLGIMFLKLMDQSFWADMFVRRTFYTTAANIGIYWDTISSYSAKEIALTGKDYGVPITFYIGEHYYGNSATNVNINAFLLALAEKGLGWYLLSVAAVGAFFAAVDHSYKKTKQAGYMLLGAMYGLLITEQAWTTALVSSGALLLLIMLSCVRFNDLKNSAKRSTHYDQSGAA